MPFYALGISTKAAPTEILFDISRQTSALPVTAEDPDWAFQDYGDRYADYSRTYKATTEKQKFLPLNIGRAPKGPQT